MDPNEARERIETGESYTVRFKTPREGQTVVQDMIRGPITFENANLEDFVFMKSSDTPTYNFAAAFDDAEMEISHVIRGDDHLSNTPRQILIHEALGNQLPAFAHVPQVLGPDKKKLSPSATARRASRTSRSGDICPRRSSTTSRSSAPATPRTRRSSPRRSWQSASASTA